MQLQEEEAMNSFDVDIAVTNPEKVGECHSIDITSEHHNSHS